MDEILKIIVIPDDARIDAHINGCQKYPRETFGRTFSDQHQLSLVEVDDGYVFLFRETEFINTQQSQLSGYIWSKQELPKTVQTWICSDCEYISNIVELCKVLESHLNLYQSDELYYHVECFKYNSEEYEDEEDYEEDEYEYDDDPDKESVMGMISSVNYLNATLGSDKSPFNDYRYNDDYELDDEDEDDDDYGFRSYYGSSRSLRASRRPKKYIRKHKILISSRTAIQKDTKIVKEFLKSFIPGNSPVIQKYRRIVLRRWMHQYVITKKEAKRLAREHEDRISRKRKRSMANKITGVAKAVLHTTDSFYDSNK